jgi:hypothetical protein
MASASSIMSNDQITSASGPALLVGDGSSFLLSVLSVHQTTPDCSCSRAVPSRAATGDALVGQSLARGREFVSAPQELAGRAKRHQHAAIAGLFRVAKLVVVPMNTMPRHDRIAA